MFLSSMHFGICGLIANIVGGTVFDHYGGRALFGAVAILCVIWAVVMATYCCVKYVNKRALRSQENEEKTNQGFRLDAAKGSEGVEKVGKLSDVSKISDSKLNRSDQCFELELNGVRNEGYSVDITDA